MLYGLKHNTDLPKDERNRRVEEAAKMMGIEDLLDKKPGSLSGGQQQRVATGRAIVREPEVFLFDEPLSNLDAKLRKHMRTELARLHSELEITSIYVTHDQEEAMTMADRIVILENGKLQQMGKPKDVYYEPANEFVADFIGSPSMNFFDVKFHRTDDGYGELLSEGFSYEIADSIVTDVERVDTDEFTLGVRPENIRTDWEQDIPPGRAISATVDVVEVIGSNNFLYLDIAGRECRVRSPPSVKPVEDESISITFDDEHIHLFDSHTGEAVSHGIETQPTHFRSESEASSP